MKKFFLFSICCFFLYVAKAQVVSMSGEELVKLKGIVAKDIDAKVHWKSLLKTANEALSAQPNPADTILSEGVLQGDPRKTRTWNSLADMRKIYALALAYKMTNEQRFLVKASEFIGAWAKRNKPQGNPINDTNLDRLIFAYDLIKADLPGQVSQTTIDWLLAVGLQELRSYDKAASGRGSGHKNNWNSHRIKVVAEIAWAVDNDSLKNWVQRAYPRQIEKNLNPDGSSFDFHERDALHYHIYDIDPLMVAATILQRADRLNESPYTYTSPKGSSLINSVNWLVPFFTGAKTHAEFVNSKSAFDKKRAANGEKGYIAGTLFKPMEAETSIELANYWDKKMLTFYQLYAKTKSKYPTWQFVLNEVKR